MNNEVKYLKNRNFLLNLENVPLFGDNKNIKKRIK